MTICERIVCSTGFLSVLTALGVASYYVSFFIF